MLMAFASYRVFLRKVPRESIPVRDRQIAPLFAIAVAGLSIVSLAGFWLAYVLTGRG
jgi:hypothetical protein